MICIYDKNTSKQNFGSNGLAVLDECVSAVITNELNGDYSLELSYPVSSYKARYLEELNIIKADGQLFRIYKAERSQGGGLTVKVWARHIFYDLVFFFIESAKILNANMKEAIELTLPPEAQSIYSITAPEGAIAPFAVVNVNSVDALFKLLEIYGGELDRDNYNIRVVEKLGTAGGVSVRYGKNIKGLTLTLDAAEVATRIYPVGADGLTLPERYVDIEGQKPLAFDIVKKVEFNGCKDAESLRAKTKEYVKDCVKPKININIDFLELSKIKDYEQYKHLTTVNLGDSVEVVHERLRLSSTLRVISKKVDLLNPVNTKIILGDPLKSIIDKLDTSSLMDEVMRLLQNNKSGVILKKNPDTVTIGTAKYAALVFGIVTKADTNLTCTLTLTGKASEDTTLSILFSLNGTEYDFKPVQRLAAGSNVMGFTLPMPQVPAGSHSFAVEMWVTNGSFVIEKNNLQITIEGLSLEGGLSATAPKIDLYYAFLFSVFRTKLANYYHSEKVSLSKPYDRKPAQISIDTGYPTFKNRFGYYHDDILADVEVTALGIYEEFSRYNSVRYVYDDDWVEFDSDFDKLPDATYESYNRVTIKEPVLTAIGECSSGVAGALFTAPLPSRNIYGDVMSITTKLFKGDG